MWARPPIRSRRLRVLAAVAAVAAAALAAEWLWLQATLFGFSARPACEVLAEWPARPNSTLPRIVHQQWKVADLPEPFARWRNATLAAFPAARGYTHMLWTDASARQLIAEHYGFFLEVYDGFPYDIVRADAARVFMLHRYGGLYLDLDYEPLRDFWALLPDDAPALVQAYKLLEESHQNSLMSSPAGHPFWAEAWRLMAERARQPRRRYAKVVDMAGPRLIDAAAERFGGGPVHTLPCELFHRPPLGEASRHTRWYNALDRYAMHGLGLVKRCGAVTDPACHMGIHHSTVSWN